MYFPRNKGETIYAEDHLPKNTGNQYGEIIIKERTIRVAGGLNDAGLPSEKQRTLPIANTLLLATILSYIYRVLNHTPVTNRPYHLFFRYISIIRRKLRFQNGLGHKRSIASKRIC